MICSNCGKEIPAGAGFCNYCGARATGEPIAGTAPAMGREAPNSTLYLILAILASVLCFLPTGIPAVVFAAKADNYRERGMPDRAWDALRKAKIWIVVSVAVGVMIVLATVALALFFTALIPQLIVAVAELIRPFLMSM